MGNPGACLLRAAVLAAAALLVGPAAALAGDPVVARTLLDSGRKALKSSKYEEAVSLLRKALQEDPALAEAAYWIAVSCEKQKDDAGALVAYREYLALLDAKGGEPSADDKKYRALAEKRIDALAAGEKDLRKVDDRLVDELLAFAKARFVRDPGIALEALDRLLAVRPDHEAALALWEKAGGKPRAASPAKAAAPSKDFVPVARWLDFLHDRLITGSTIKYEGAVMVTDAHGGTKVTPNVSPDLGPRYAYETEFRVVESYSQGWLVGISFGEKKGDFLAAFVQRAQAVLLHASEAGGRSELGTYAMTPIEPSTWHRVGVAVRGQDVEVWLDGASVIKASVSDRPDLAGEIGVWQQDCRTERKVLRGGKL